MKKTNNLPFEIRKKGTSNEELASQLAQKAAQTYTDTELAKKRDKSALISMLDLGQDVKTGMTGGSVAVVGLGVVNNLHINKNQITIDKLTNSIIINKSDLEILYSGQYVKTDGTLATSASFNVRRLIIPNECKKITLNGTTDITPSGIIKYQDTTFTTLQINKTYNTHYCELWLNEQISTSNGVMSVALTFTQKGYKNETQFDPIGKDELVGNGYIRNNTVTSSNTYSRYKIPIIKGYKYKANLSAIGGYMGCLYDANDTFLGDITIKNGYIELKKDTAYIIVNITNDDTVYAEKIAELKVYSHSVNKPYVFNGKTALFFGDSITQGYINGSTISGENYVKKFSNKVGLTYTNKGIGGALFTSGKNAVETIPTTIQNTTLNKDFVFIAGGTNDFGLGAEIADFKTAISTLCTYLKANYTGEVIFITPINRVTTSNDEKAPLNMYRNIIAEYAMQNGYSVVDGSKLNFPEEAGDYASIAFGDGLHPSEIGYSVYAKSLATVLC